MIAALNDQEAAVRRFAASALKTIKTEPSNWVSELRQRFQGKPIATALEQKRGALLYSLMRYEFIVLYPINPQAAEDGGGMITLWKFPADRGILFRRPGSLICAWIDAATHGCDIERIGGSAAITDRRH